MDHYALCLQIPPGWDRLDGDPSATRERLHRRFSAYALTPEVEESLLAEELAAIEGARKGGTVLWVAQTRGVGTMEDPLSTLSLLVAAHPGPSSQPAEGTQATAPSTGAQRAPDRALDLTLSGAKGVFRERRTTQRPAGAATTISVFQAQAIIVPDDRTMVVTLTGSTPDPARESEARMVVEKVAKTLRLVPVHPAEIS